MVFICIKRYYFFFRYMYVYEGCWVGDLFRGQILGKLKGCEDDFVNLVGLIIQMKGVLNVFEIFG